MSDSLPLDGPSRPPASGQTAKQAVVLLHGYGADGNDLIGLAPLFARALPDAVFYSPNAPEPSEMAPYGRQWFSLAQYDPDLLRRDPERLAPAFAAMYEGAKKAAVPLNSFLDGILERHDLTADKLAVIGFSQGTMMALHVCLRRTSEIGAMVGYSGAMVGAEELGNEIRSKPPILLVHGQADPVVPVTALGYVQRALDGVGVTYSAHVVPGLGHGIDQTGADLGAEFLRTHLHDDT